MSESTFSGSDTDDIVDLFTQPVGEVIELRQARIVDVDAGADTNTVEIGGGHVHDLPVLQTVTLTTLSPNDVVLVVRFRSQYFILGKIVSSS